MRFKTVLVSLALLVLVSTPVFAESSWVEQFLRRYQPSFSYSGGATSSSNVSGTSATASGTDPQQVLQTGEIPIALSDLVTLMLQKNLNIQADRFTPRSTYLQALALWQSLMPSFTAGFTEGRNTAANTNQINGANVTSLSTLTHTFTAGFSQIFQPGTNVAVNFSMIRTSSNNALATFNPAYTGRVTYSVIQPLLLGRGKLVNTRSIMQGLNNEKSAEAAFEVQLDGLIAAAEKAYWNLVFTNQNLAVNQRSLDESLVELDQDQTKLEIGTLAQSDVVQTRASVAARRLSLVAATYAQAQAEDQIKKMISDQTDPGMFLIKLKALDTPRLTAPVPTLEEGVKIALENRPEIRQNLLAIQNAEIDVKYYHNLKEPNLSLTGTYTQNGTGGNQIVRSTLGGTSSTVIPGGLGDALSQLFGYNFNGYTAGFSLVVPLNNKAVDANYGYAMIERKQTGSSLKTEQGQVALDVRVALTEVAQAKAQIEWAQATLDLAKEQRDNEQIKLDLGTSQIRFVLEDQITVATDETALLQAQVSFGNALVDLEQATGLTLKNNNIDLMKGMEQTGLPDPTAPIHPGTLLNLFKKQQ